MVYIVAHLIITIAVIAAYIYTVAIGQPSETLKMAIVVIIGFWFGATGDKVRKQVLEAEKKKDV